MKFIPFPLHFHILSFQLQPIVRHRLLRQHYHREFSLHPHFQCHHFHYISVHRHLILPPLIDHFHSLLLHLLPLVVCVLQLPVVLQALYKYIERYSFEINNFHFVYVKKEKKRKCEFQIYTRGTSCTPPPDLNFKYNARIVCAVGAFFRGYFLRNAR